MPDSDADEKKLVKCANQKSLGKRLAKIHILYSIPVLYSYSCVCIRLDLQNDTLGTGRTVRNIELPKIS